MKVYLVTDVNAKSKRWYVVHDYQALLAQLEKEYGQERVALKMDHVTDEVAYFLSHQETFDRVYMGKKKEKKS